MREYASCALLQRSDKTSACYGATQACSQAPQPTPHFSRVVHLEVLRQDKQRRDPYVCSREANSQDATRRQISLGDNN